MFVGKRRASTALLSLGVSGLLALMLASGASAGGNPKAHVSAFGQSQSIVEEIKQRVAEEIKQHLARFEEIEHGIHACENGGFNSLVGTEGQTFGNVFTCILYVFHGGKFASGIIIPKGHTATLTKARLSADDPLTYGYQLNFGANVEVGQGGSNPENTPNVTLGPYPTAELLRVWLTDNFGLCPGYTFYSDGPHGFVSGSNPFLVEIADSDVCASPPSQPRRADNLEATVTIN